MAAHGALSAELLVGLLASTRKRRVARRSDIVTALEDVDAATLLRVLGEQRLTAVALARLREVLGHELPTELEEADAAIRAATAVRAVVLTAAEAEVLALLRGAGIAAMPVKGTSVGIALYGDEASRPTTDVDVLVGPEALRDASRVLMGAGWRLVGEPLEGLPRLHLELRADRAWLPPLELHWRVHWYERRFSAELLADAASTTDTSPRDLALELASLLLFYQRDGFLGLRHAADLAQWWDRFGGDLEPAAVAELVHRHPELHRALAAAAYVAERTVGAPAWVVTGALPPPDRRTQVAVGLQNSRGRGTPEQQRAEVDLIDALLAPPGTLASALRRTLLPGRRHVVGDGQPTGPGAAWLTATHPLKTGSRMVAALVRSRMARARRSLAERVS